MSNKINILSSLINIDTYLFGKYLLLYEYLIPITYYKLWNKLQGARCQKNVHKLYKVYFFKLLTP